MVILEGMLQAMEGRAPTRRGVPVQAEEPLDQFRITAEIEEITYTYDTQLLVHGSDLALERMREELGSMGDSMLIVGISELAKVHIHTNNPGKVLEACLVHGDLRDVSIENMREQFEALKAARAAAGGGPSVAGTIPAGAPPSIPAETEPKEAAVIAVAVGEGIAHIFRSLGVDVIINGGQTMNPSTEELVKAIESAPCPRVLLLPNNTNILMAAKQAMELTESEVSIVPSPNIPKGIAALLAYNPQAAPETNCARMAQAMDNTRCGEVTYAVRSARHGDMQISEGDVLGITEDEIVAVGEDPNAVLEQLLEKLLDETSEFVSVFYGVDVAQAQADTAARAIQDRHPELEIEVHYGGQPLFYYLVSVE